MIPSYIHLTDRPTGHYDVQKIIEGMKAFKRKADYSNYVHEGTYQGQDVNNTTDRYVLPWLEVVKKIAPRQVMIYTIDRETPDHDLEKATHKELDKIGGLVKEAGIPVSVILSEKSKLTSRASKLTYFAHEHILLFQVSNNV